MIKPEDLAKSGTEHGSQAALFCWASTSNIPELKWLFAIPNGGLRNPATAARLKAEGVKSGVSDIFLPVTSTHDLMRNYYGLFIEMKRPKGVPTLEQIKFSNFVMDNGYRFVVCYSWTEARDEILRYLGK